jgi:hypothetical protein
MWAHVTVCNNTMEVLTGHAPIFSSNSHVASWGPRRDPCHHLCADMAGCKVLMWPLRCDDVAFSHVLTMAGGYGCRDGVSVLGEFASVTGFANPSAEIGYVTNGQPLGIKIGPSKSTTSAEGGLPVTAVVVTGTERWFESTPLL